MAFESETAVFAVVVAFAIVALAVFLRWSGYLIWLAGRLFALPGVVIHEFAHKCACDLVGVPVVEVVYFRFGDPAGYVRHARPERYRASFTISVAPFLVNTVVSFWLFLALAALVSTVGDLRTARPWVLTSAIALGWFALSIGIAAVPSTGDANTLWNRSRSEWRRSPIVLLGIPVVLVIYVANLLSWLWADVLYALAIGLIAFYLFGLAPI
ncbi:metalloprotease family protein [Halosolutus gelatinilyticus]|uniref:metalloprotease family protein n=1 Tax=Halosolutus gelatinilyticus TaxID=2931975 RepID=UPI001FF6D68E|nr:metalloprotease family protein [Halosolutus gelatinilyticus]